MRDKTERMLCPFHKEKTPSLFIKRKKGIFKCFGCGKEGTVEELEKELKKRE